MESSGEVQRVADAVLRRIVAGDYPAGLRLPSEAELSAELDVGRSTVREALRQLASMGVVKSRRGSGAMVLDFRREGTPALLPAYVTSGRFDMPPMVLAKELLHLRAHLAAEAVRVAAIYAKDDALEPARSALAEAARVEDDPVAHTAREMDFFRALVQASGIWPVVWLANVFWAPMRELQTMIAAAAGPVPVGFQAAMTAVLEAIERSEPEVARQRVTAWLNAVDENLVNRMQTLFEGARAPSTKPASARHMAQLEEA